MVHKWEDIIGRRGALADLRRALHGVRAGGRAFSGHARDHNNEPLQQWATLGIMNRFTIASVGVACGVCCSLFVYPIPNIHGRRLHGGRSDTVSVTGLGRCGRPPAV